MNAPSSRPVLRLAALVTPLLLALAPARADVVHLESGGTISGKVVRDDAEGVVLRTPDGTITVPRRMVARVERQSAGETKLALARERLKAGAYEEAERLFEEAAQDADPAVAARAQAELASMRRDRAKQLRRPPRTPLALPEGAQGRPIEGGSLQEQLDRARSAIDGKNGLRAARLLAPLAADNPEQPVLRYLYGRALELARRDEPAKAEFLAALGRADDPRSTAWLGDLARRAQAGLPARPATPGHLREGWQRAEPTQRFAIYHALLEPEPWLEREPELALELALEAVHLERHQLYLSGRVQLLVYRDAAALAADVAELGASLGDAGHEPVLPAPDGPLWLLAAPGHDPARYRQAVRHQMVHLLLREVRPDTPAWLREGIACALDPPAVRARRRAAPPADLRAFLLAPPPEDPSARARWRGEAQLVFEALDRRLGRVETIQFGRQLTRRGLEEALRRAKLELAELELN